MPGSSFAPPGVALDLLDRAMGGPLGAALGALGLPVGDRVRPTGRLFGLASDALRQVFHLSPVATDVGASDGVEGPTNRGLDALGQAFHHPLESAFEGPAEWEGAATRPAGQPHALPTVDLNGRVTDRAKSAGRGAA